MKKEVLIIILVVFGIIALSILLKYVVFKGYTVPNTAATKNICTEICKREKFSVGRCGLGNDCLEGEFRVIPKKGKELNNFEAFCNPFSQEIKSPAVVSSFCCCK